MDPTTHTQTVNRDTDMSNSSMSTRGSARLLASRHSSIFYNVHL